MFPFKNLTPSSFRRRSSQPRHKRSAQNQTSCFQCRRSKVKCDLRKPCRQCTLRGHSTNCRYNSTIIPVPREFTCRPTESQPCDETEDRPPGPIGPISDTAETHLAEGIDIPDGELRIDECPKTSLRSSSPFQNQEEISGLNVTYERNHHTPDLSLQWDNPHSWRKYFCSTHWASLVTLLPEICLFLERHPTFCESWRLLARIKMFYAHSTTELSQDLSTHLETDLASLFPSRDICDMCVQNFWSTVGQMMPVVQKANFSTKYESSFRPSHSGDMKFSLQLAVIIAVGYISDVSDHGIGQGLSMRQKGARDLLGIVEKVVFTHKGLRKPSLALLEVFMLLFIAKSLLSEADGPDGMCAILGILQKMSFSLGLHCEVNIFQPMPKEQCERRRQLWNIVRILDYEYSIHSGAPQTIPDNKCDSHIPVFGENKSHSRKEHLQNIWFSSLTKITIRSTSMIKNRPNNAVPSDQVECHCRRISEEMGSFKLVLDHEISQLANTWISCGMPGIFAFYHLVLNVIWQRTKMILYQPLLSTTAHQPHTAWHPFIDAATSILKAYHDFVQSQTNISDSWWYFYSSFIRYDIYRATFGICYAVTRMISDHLPGPTMANASGKCADTSGSGHAAELHASNRQSSPTHHAQDWTPTIDDLLQLVEKTRDLAKRNIPFGINYAKAYQILSMAVVRMRHEVYGEDILAGTRQEAERSLALASRIAFNAWKNEKYGVVDGIRVHKNDESSSTLAPVDNRASQPNSITNDFTGATNHLADTATGFMEYRGNTHIPLSSFSGIYLDDIDLPNGDGETLSEQIDWEWFDQLINHS